MITLSELENYIISAKLEYNIEREKLRNLENVYLLIDEKEQDAINNLKYLYLIHDMNETHENHESKYLGNILHASFIHDYDFTTLYQSVKAHELYINETKQAKLEALVALKSQHNIVIEAIKLFQKAFQFKEKLICESINVIIENFTI
jgi:hypothetical protein